MASNGSSHHRATTTPEIPLQDLARPPEGQQNRDSTHRRVQSDRGRRFFGRAAGSPRLFQQGYAPLSEEAQPAVAGVDQIYPSPNRRSFRHSTEPESPGVDVAGFQEAIGFAGLSFQDESPNTPMGASSLPQRPAALDQLLGTNDSTNSLSSVDIDDQRYDPPTSDRDTVPLTALRTVHSTDPLTDDTPSGQPHDRFDRLTPTSVRFRVPESPSASRYSRLGDDLSAAEEGMRRSFDKGTSPSRAHGLSPVIAESPFLRAGSIVRKMSQRVVNLSNEPEMAEQSIRRRRSQRPISGRIMDPRDLPDISEYATDGTQSPIEKTNGHIKSVKPVPYHNPLKGKALGIFPPDSPIRTRLCEILVHPFTEPFILLLILFQAILLAVEAAPDVYLSPRSRNFGTSWSDYALLALFCIYTVEIALRIMVSGFVINPVEYSTINRGEVGFKKAMMRKGQSLFALEQTTPQTPKVQEPEGPTSHMNGDAHGPAQPSIIRALTYTPATATVPGHGRQAQRMRLAHRAFLRHSFNRVDFLAVISYWISFAMSLTGYESTHHVWIFRMMSCLRILRLLSLTSGTSIILRSLKKAAPLLLNVALLIGFFWLIFGIVGVQAFKSSFRRRCVWSDPNGVLPNYTVHFQFCGGSLAEDGTVLPWRFVDGSGPGVSKGYLCPPNSYCVSSRNPYNGTVNYDNILQSLELVFVIMTSNTFSDLMYYLADSDYLIAAIFSAAGIIIMYLWLMNLLIAVITSSFQIIREESESSAFANKALTPKLVSEKTNENKNALKRLYDKTFWFWIVVIAYGLICQCLRSSAMSLTREKFINGSETVVTFILLIEIIVRFAVDWRNFFRKPRNWVDLFLAIITSIIQIPVIHDSGQPYAWLTIFQILRIYRVVLAVPWTRQLIMLVLGNVSGILNLILFVFLLTFLTAILAAQLFRGELPRMDNQGNIIHINFATIYNCFLGMYQVLSSENWTILLYNVTSYDYRWGTAWIGAIFFILWFILAFFIVLNMFIAVIQENFDVSEDEKRLQQVKAFLQRKELGETANGTLSLSAMFKIGRFGRKQDPLDYGPAMMDQLLKQAVVQDFLLEEPGDQPSSAMPAETPTSQQHAVSRPLSTMIYDGTLGTLQRWFPKIFQEREPNPFYSRYQFSRANEDLDPHTMAKEVVSAAERRKRDQKKYLVEHPKYNDSLFIFKEDNPIRRLCQKIVGPGRGTERIRGLSPSPPIWYTFSALLYAAIVAMVLLACVTTPLYQKQYFQRHNFSVTNWFVFTDMGFAAIFTIEAAIRIIADGLFWTPHAYFRSSWGLIDGVVLITLWINVVASLTNQGAVSRAVGAFKALRALRLLNVSDSARETFHSVIVRGGWKVLSAAFVSISLLIPFAVYGLNLFNGQMQFCNDKSSGIHDLTNCVNEYNSTPYNWDLVAPRRVANPYYNFDNFGQSLFILFQIVSQEGWTDVLWSAESITGFFKQPRPYASQFNAVFFVIFNLLGTVFVLTLFVSVFMRNYTEQTGVAFLTTDQRSWLELRKLLRQVSPSKRPAAKKKRSRWSQWCYRVSVTKTGRWTRFVTTVLVFHLILLCLEFYPAPIWWEDVRNFIFLVLTIFYICNIAIRITGLTWTRFRRSSWDLFSIFAVGGTFIVTILFLTDFNGGPSSRVHTIYNQIHKLFLVSIVLLLIPRNNQLDQLFKTAAASLTAIANLLATWFVLFLVFAIALTQTFGLTRFNSNETGNINFRDVPKALILLFRMSVGEGWNQIMEDFATVVPPYCTNSDNFLLNDCGSPEWARALFISWNILSMYIFVNMFVSLIFESFSYVYQRSSGLSVISRDEIRRFKEAWAMFDPDGTGFITTDAFPRLLGELSGVFEMRVYHDPYTIRALKEECKITRRTSSLPIDEAYYTPEQIDVKILNDRLSKIRPSEIEEIRQRRQRLNVFYEEVLNSADPDRGIGFTSLLMTLAHYKVINDNKSLRLEEFLRRRARLQRVEDDVRRRIVSNFLDTVYWRREFLRERAKKDSARMTTIPQLQVPEIFVEDEDSPISPKPGYSEGRTKPALSLTIPRFGASTAPRTSGSDARDSGRRPSSGGSALRHRADSQASPPSPARSSISRTSLDSRRSGDIPSPVDASDTELVRTAPPVRASPGLWGSRPADQTRHNRSGSAVSARDVLDVFDNSAWGESLRRSMTSGVGRGGGGQQRGRREGSADGGGREGGEEFETEREREASVSRERSRERSR